MTRNKPYFIKTERLILRSMCDTDCDDVCSLLTNKQIAKTYMLPDFKSREEEVKLFNLLMDLSNDLDRFVFGIDLGGSIIGFINDVEIIDSTIELGFVINPEYHNCGYATEVLMQAIDTLHDMGYATVKTGAFECNLASQRVMEKAGMQRLDSTEEIEYRGVVHRCIMFEKRAKKMKKVIIIGCPGAGKTTFAEKLRDKTGLPLYYLDAIWHKHDRTHISRADFVARLTEILAEDRWIIDGNYSRTIDVRLKECDTVFLFDLPTDVCLQGATERLGRERYDMPWIAKELDPEFKCEIERFSIDVLPEIYNLLEKHGQNKNVVVFRTREMADNFISSLGETNDNR